MTTMASSSTDSNLHGWRSRAIDAFAHAEANVLALLAKLKVDTGAETLGPRIDRLCKAKTLPNVPLARKKELDAALMELRTLVEIRNDLVHAPMVVRQDGEHAIACFANPKHRCEFSSTRREITAPRLQALAGRVTALAKVLEAP